MSSLVIYGNEFAGHLDNGLAPEFFKYRFLAEGDSWMDRSAMFHTSLLQQLAPRMDAAGDDVLVINLAHFGDTMRRIGECANGDFKQWLNTAFSWKFDAILLSAGGNDFIDAARDPDAGQGILRNLAVTPPPTLGRDCLNRNAINTLVTQYLDPGFSKLYQEVQASRHAGVPIFLNSYDTPTARNAPAFPGGSSWLYASYVKNGIPSNLWPDLTNSIFDEVKATITRWLIGRSGLYQVPTNGTLIPSAPGSTGDSGDWLNEIHPNASGWDKLADVWQLAIKKVLL
ncbi:MAG: hypothetical protein HY066_09915 [Betaproteobacteria bacterium]|nr:hypothetical protein [Betaproteobacteria bacterium]